MASVALTRKTIIARSRGLLAAIAIVVTASLVALPFRGVTDADNLTMVYLTAVVVIALKFGLDAAVLGSVASVALFNFLFTSPFYSFTAINPASYITFGIMLVSSLLAATLTSGLRDRFETVSDATSETKLMLDIAQELSKAGSVNEAEAALARRLASRYQARVVIERGDRGGSADPGEGHPVVEVEGSVWRLALNARDHLLGTIVLEHAEPLEPTLQQRLELETIGALTAGTLLRIANAEAAMRAVAAEDSERLRNVLLSSLSHDLRTPLTLLSGTVANLTRLHKKLPRDAIEEIAQLSRQVTQLQKFTGNLLKMAAISSGQLRLNKEPYAMQEIVGATLQRMANLKGERQFRTSVDGVIPLVPMDGALIEQVLSNLVDNAISHTDTDGIIMVKLEKTPGAVKTSVLDNGPGLSPGDEDLVFERFRTGASFSDRKTAGNHGLGLAICRGIVEAHGGTIDAGNNKDGPGACFSFVLPVTPSVPEARHDPGH